MRIVITGGAGFIGSNLVRRFIAAGVSDVVVIDDLSTGLESNLEGLDVDLRVGSILDADLVSDAIAPADAVVHLAALPSVPRSVQFPADTTRVNVIGTLNVLEACRASGRSPMIAFASSSSVYGSSPATTRVETVRCEPMSPYAASKLAAEAYVLAYQSSYGIPAIAFRFFNVYGPYQRPDHAYAPVVPRFVRAVQNDEPFTVYGDGLQTRDFTYIDSVAETIQIAALERRSHRTAVNLAFGTCTTVRDLAIAVADIMQVEARFDIQPPRVGDVRDSSAQSDTFRRLFPEVQPTELADGLAATVDYLERIPVAAL